MTLKERLEIVKEYHKWFEETNGKNDFDLLDCPETLMAFLQSKGLLNDRPKGEWVWRSTSQWCSECSALKPRKYPYSNYCPNCGADMRGKRNGNN